MKEYEKFAKKVLNTLGINYDGELQDMIEKIRPGREFLMSSTDFEIYNLRIKIAEGIEDGESLEKLRGYHSELEDKIKYSIWD